jgi:hypothetical protein
MKLKPVHISILVIVVFIAALIAGMQSDWWRLDGRKTPLDDNFNREHDEELTEGSSDEEDHEKTEVTGSSTVQDALDLGLSIEDIEKVLEGEIEDENALIKEIAAQRGLRFGVVKDSLNALIDD